jgi:protein O-GlcNAc transferase
MTTSGSALQKAFQVHNWDEVVRLCHQHIRRQPRHELANRYLGHALFKLHRAEESISAYAAARRRLPQDMELALNFGNTLMELGRYMDARPHLELVTKRRPDRYVTWMALSQCLYQIQEPRQGLDAAVHMLELSRTREEEAVALTHRALHSRELGYTVEAVRDCTSAIELNPADPTNYVNRQLFMLADPLYSAMDMRERAVEYAEQFETPRKCLWPAHDASGRQPWERLKVGFLSPDLRVHSVMYFAESLIARLDRRQFEVHALYLHPSIDAVTERVQRHSDAFFHLAFASQAERLQFVTDARYDILIDLAGHTGNNGLAILLNKPAPMQVSWLGFPATTGLSAMDYKFTDHVTDPEGAEQEYTEKLFRMDSLFCCYRPHSRNPLWRYQPAYVVKPTPAMTNGWVTFGSCNNLGKLTDGVLTLWGELLRSNERYRLLIEGKNLDQSEFADQFQQRCAGLGVPTDRLLLVGLDARNQYLTYHDIDIALDPFPLTGGTTTFDLLWMGVPLVSMRGDSFKSRLSTGILTYLQQEDWLADTPQQYLSIAQALASDVDRLNSVRLGLRQRVESSCLMDEERFVQAFGNGLRTIWQRWLSEQLAPGDAPAQQALQNQWLADQPTELAGPIPKALGVETGVRIDLSQAYATLQRLLDEAKQMAEPPQTGQISHPLWQQVTEFCEALLCAIPNDPMALACLAEVEHVHGHTEFAVTYLRYAQQNIAK